MEFYCFGGAYDLNGNLAEGYNKHCRLVPNDDDVIMIADADIMHLTPEYGKVIMDYVKKYPEFELWTCYTNRVKCRPQLQKDMFFEDKMSEHRKRAVKLYNNKRYDVKEIYRVISGYVMIFQKKTWKKYGGFKGSGVVGIDTIFSRRVLEARQRIGLMEAVYVMHYYRFNDGIQFNPYKSSKGQKG